MAVKGQGIGQNKHTELSVKRRTSHCIYWETKRLRLAVSVSPFLLGIGDEVAGEGLAKIARGTPLYLRIDPWLQNPLVIPFPKHEISRTIG